MSCEATWEDVEFLSISIQKESQKRKLCGLFNSRLTVNIELTKYFRFYVILELKGQNNDPEMTKCVLKVPIQIRLRGWPLQRLRRNTYNELLSDKLLYVLLRSGSVQHYWNEIFYFVDHLAHKFIRYVSTQTSDLKRETKKKSCFGFTRACLSVFQPSAADVFYCIFNRRTDSHGSDRGQVQTSSLRRLNGFIYLSAFFFVTVSNYHPEIRSEPAWRSWGWCSRVETRSCTRVSKE